MTVIKSEYEQGRAAGRREALENLRQMLEVMATAGDQDIARCARLLLEGVNSGMK